MSYDISFWKPRPDAAADPQSIYERLSDGQRVEEIEPLPVEDIIAALGREFPTLDMGEDFPGAELPQGHMEVSHSERHFRFDFRGPETGAEKAAVWRVLSGFGCVCYDPQDGSLYTADNPPPYRALTPDEVKKIEKMIGGRDIASIMQHMQRQQRRRALVGCATLVVLSLVVLAVLALLVRGLVRLLT